MPYLVLQLDAAGISLSEALLFASVDAAQAALAAVRDSFDEVITITSDSGELLRVRRAHVANAFITSEAPPTDDAPPADVDALRERLGPPVYEGPNGFTITLTDDSLPAAVRVPRDEIVLWRCQGEPHLQMCLAERRHNAEWRYWPCEIHRQSQPLDLQ